MTSASDKGMWAFHRAPVDAVKEKYGFAITPEWLNHVQLASVRLNDGGSGSFVSAQGLVLTNHHVAVGQLQKVSTQEKDYVRDGFYARGFDQELKCPDLEMNVLIRTDNVTDRVMGAVKSGASPEEANKQRKAAMAQIEKESTEKSGMRSDVVDLYQGGEFWLYQYKKYTDVRLVMAPEKGAAYFGGDFDNFSFPRHDLDFAFFRVYEDGKPVQLKPDQFFRWSKNGAGEGELVFTSGHPGATHRLLTIAQLQFDRDVSTPVTFNGLRRMKQVLEDYSAQGPEQERQAKTELFSINNSLKAREGMHEGLKSPAVWETKEKEERELRGAVAKDPALAAELASAWDKIAAAKIDHASKFKEQLAWRFLRFGDLPNIADTLVKYVSEVLKPNDKRFEEFRDSALESLNFRLFSPAPIYPAMEEKILAAGLEFFIELMGAGHPFIKDALGSKSAPEFARDAIAGSKLADPEARKQLIDGGGAAVENSNDPLIQFFRKIDPHYRKMRAWYEDSIQSVEVLTGNQIAKARFAVYGKAVAPDATFTLRLSYGVVKGYEQLTTLVPAWTTYYGLFDRGFSFNNREPFQLAERVRAKMGSIDLKTPLNFVSTNDITGGNSGSPVINRAAEIVGLIFDGNIQSLPNDYVYTDAQARAVSVHSAGIMEALRNIYGMDNLAAEILAAAPEPAFSAN